MRTKIGLNGTAKKAYCLDWNTISNSCSGFRLRRCGVRFPEKRLMQFLSQQTIIHQMNFVWKEPFKICLNFQMISIVHKIPKWIRRKNVLYGSNQSKAIMFDSKYFNKFKINAYKFSYNHNEIVFKCKCWFILQYSYDSN